MKNEKIENEKCKNENNVSQKCKNKNYVNLIRELKTSQRKTSFQCWVG
jgi:hypothetical protein